MSHFEISCPTCQKRLRLALEHSGKSVRCPGCRNIFAANAPAAEGPVTGRGASDQPGASPGQPRRARIISSSEPPKQRPADPPPEKRKTSNARPPKRKSGTPAASSAGYDEETDWTEDTADSWANDESGYEDPFTSDPYATEQQPQRRKKSGPSAAKGLLTFLLIWLAIFGALLAVGAGGYYLFQNLPSVGGNFVDLDYLPQNVDAVVHIRLRDVLNAPVLANIKNRNPAAFNNGMTNVIQPEDIESITMGIWENGSATAELPGAAALLSSGNGATGWIAVARCSRAVNPGGAGLSIAEKYKGIDLYRDTSNKFHWFADTYTVVIGDEAEIKASVDRNGKEFRQEKFDFAPSSGQIVIAAVGMQNQNSAASSLAGSPFAAASQLQTLMNSSVDRWGMSIGVSSNISVDLGLNCKTGSGAQQIHTEFQNLLAQGRSQLTQLSSSPLSAAPQLQTVIKIGGDLLNSVQVSQSGTTVSLSASIQKSQIDQIADLANSMPGAGMMPPGM